MKLHDVLMNSMFVFSRAEIKVMEEVKRSDIRRIPEGFSSLTPRPYSISVLPSKDERGRI